MNIIKNIFYIFSVFLIIANLRLIPFKKIDSNGDFKNKKYENCLIQKLPLNPNSALLIGNILDKDSDNDGLTDPEEKKYGSDKNNPDSDGDGYQDGEEVAHGYSPTAAGSDEKSRLTKKIIINLNEQRLRYYYGDYGEQKNFLISSGVKKMPTPKGNFSILEKKPIKLYRGRDYYLPNTKWNLQFLPSFYIHGAYWHNNFGKPMSHGCINVSYSDMEKLYNWAEVGTKIIIE